MVDQFKNWWDSLNLREKQLVGAGGVLFVITVIYWGIWHPINSKLEKANLTLQRAEKTLLWVEKKSQFLVNHRGGLQKQTQKMILSELMTQSGQKFGIKFTRITEKKQTVAVSLDKIAFTQLARWLVYLENNYSVVVIDIDLAKADQQGFIKVNRLSLGYQKA